jgi:hypothetical protein
MITKKGSELPEGATVFMTNFGNSFRVWRSVIKRQYDPFRIDLDYIFDPADELWATPLAREIWDEHPCCHPHCTLFDILYEKLELQNYGVLKLQCGDLVYRTYLFK